MSELIQQHPPAGWYPDPSSGHLRWWDGQSWGVYAPPAQPAPFVVMARPLKEPGLAYVFLLLLGGFAAHHFYLRQYAAAIIMLTVWWVGWGTTVVGVGWILVSAVVIWWIVDLFSIPGYVRNANARIAAGA